MSSGRLSLNLLSFVRVLARVLGLGLIRNQHVVGSFEKPLKSSVSHDGRLACRAILVTIVAKGGWRRL